MGPAHEDAMVSGVARREHDVAAFKPEGDETRPVSTPVVRMEQRWTQRCAPFERQAAGVHLVIAFVIRRRREGHEAARLRGVAAPTRNGESEGPTGTAVAACACGRAWRSAAAGTGAGVVHRGR